MNTRHIAFRSNRVCDIISCFHQRLDPLYGSEEVRTLVEMLFEAYLGWGRTQLLLSRQATINQSDLLRMHHALADLERWKPIQYIIGNVSFCGCTIEVNPSVLIPRPETEQMVHWIVAESLRSTPRSILDLCTGSGCIAIALAHKWPEAKVEAVDISAESLAVAQRNAERNGVEVRLEQADVLQGEWQLCAAPYSLITANPPYVRQSESQQMRRNVLDYEPERALFVPDDDPLLFYQSIARIAQQQLAEEGLLVMEINEALAQPLIAMLQEAGFRAAVHDDFRERNRWVAAQKA